MSSAGGECAVIGDYCDDRVDGMAGDSLTGGSGCFVVASSSDGGCVAVANDFDCVFTCY